MTEQADDLAARLLALLPRLQRWAAAAVLADRGDGELSLRQLAVLYLVREGAGRPGLLARRLKVSPAVVTGLLDRLEQRGYLRRAPDPGDRRRTRLELTAHGLETSLAVQRVLTQGFAAGFATGGADPDDLRRGLAALERTATALEAGMAAFGPDALDAGWNEEAADGGRRAEIA